MVKSGKTIAANIPNMPTYTLCSTFHTPLPETMARQKSITETATVAISVTRIASALSTFFCLLDDVFLDVFCFVFLLVFFVAIFTSYYFITS